jgi:hypothetical protein
VVSAPERLLPGFTNSLRSRPFSFAACRATLSFFANSFSPQPYVRRFGFEPPPGGVKYATSTPPPPWVAMSRSSSWISWSSRYAPGHHQRYFWRTTVGGSANVAAVSAGAYGSVACVHSARSLSSVQGVVVESENVSVFA